MPEDNETLSLHYEVSVEDKLGFSLYHAMHSPTIKRALRLYRFVPPAIWTGLGLLLLLAAGVEGATMAITFFLLSLLWIPLAPKIWYARVKKQTRKMLIEGLVKNREAVTLSISPQGLHTEAEEIESKMKWSMVKKVETTPSHLYLYVNNINALVVPKSAFASEMACEQFLQKLRHYREQAAGLHALELNL